MKWMLIVAGLWASPALAQEGTVVVPAGAANTSAPDQYVIQPGDTLWDISTAFMGDSYYWPRLWSINDYITNPHWIYPGNVIIFRPGTLLEAPSMELGGGDDPYQDRALTFDSAPPECGPDVRFDNDMPTARYVAPGVLADDEELEIWGEAFASKSGNVSLGEGDTIYLNLDDPDLVDCGDVLSIYRQGEAVRHPEERKVRYGSLYQVIAEVVVVHREGDTTVAEVRTSYKEARRGDVVGPAFPVEAELPVSAPRGDLDAVVIARLGSAEHHLSAVGETVFLDRGKADGLRVGNSFFIVHRRDPVLTGRDDDDRIPAQVSGRVVVVRVQENTATAVVVDASAIVSVGDTVAMHVEGQP